MLPSVIDKLEDAAEGDRPHYSVCMKTGSKNYGKFTLQLDGKHPVQVKNTELLTQITGFADEKTRLEAKAIPDGKVAVEPNIAELGETALGLGLKAKKDVSDLKTRADTATSKLEEDATAKLNARVSAAAGKNLDAWTEHVKARGTTFKETTIKDDKGVDVTAITAISKDADGKEVESPLKDYVEKSAAHVAAANAQKKRGFGFPKEETAEGETNEFDEIRKTMDASNKTKQVSNHSFAETFFGTKSGFNA